MFKYVNINISGGSVTKRHFISTAHLNLSLFLLKLGYSAKDIYRSFNLSKTYSNLNVYPLDSSQQMMLLVINSKLKEQKAILLESIKNSEKDIIINQNNILRLEKESSSRQNKKSYNLTKNQHEL